MHESKNNAGRDAGLSGFNCTGSNLYRAYFLYCSRKGSINEIKIYARAKENRKQVGI